MQDNKQAAERWNLALAIGSGLVFLAVALFYGFLSPGAYYDDDISHYLIARSTWHHPMLLWNTWGRPGFTALYAPVSLLGFGAARAFSAVLALAACFIAARVARLYGARWWWVAVPLTAFQPEHLRQAFSTSTELSAAFFLCAALLAYKSGRWTLLGLLAGITPLARYELIPVCAVFGVILLRKRAYAGLALLVLPMATQNILNAVTGGGLQALLFPFDYAAGAHPNQGVFDYADNSPFYYLLASPKIFGWIPVLLMLWGAIRSRVGLLHTIIAMVFVLLAVATGAIVPKNVPVYHRYAAIISPIVGVLAAVGFDRLWSAAAGARDLPGTRIPIPHLAGVLAAIALAAQTASAVKPFMLTPARMTAMEAARWFKSSPYADRLVVCSHVWFAYAADLDRHDTSTYLSMTADAIEAAPPGSIIVWDRHYSPRLHFLVPLEYLQDPNRFRPLYRGAGGRKFEIHVFEKMF